MKLLCVILFVLLAAELRGATPRGRLEDGPHLFVDDYWIASARNVKRAVNRPERDPSIGNPVITGKEDGCFQPFMTVVRDAKTKKFRIWYGGRTEDRRPTQSRLAYMESDDGVRWQRPARMLETPFIQFGASVLDEGPDFVKNDERYKFVWWAPSIAKGDLPGMKLAMSPDGLKWGQHAPPNAKGDVFIAHNHDINGIFRDTIRNRYLAIASTYVTDPAWEGERRVTCQSTSIDAIRWSPLQRILVPDPKTEHEQTQFYAMDGLIIRGGLIIGMVKVLRDDLKADDPPDPPEAYGIGYTALAWTRDGENWTRDREVFFDRDPRKGAWDHSHAWIDEQLPVSDDVYLYYGGYARGHKVNRFEERQIGLVKMQRDRYVVRESGEETGELKTPLVLIDADTLTVNAAARGGAIHAQVCDENGDAVPSFTFADCTPVGDDGLNLPVRWNEPLSKLRGRSVHLVFRLTNARIFAFDK